MRQFLLALIIGILCAVILTAHATEDDATAAEESCDPKTDETCENVEEELDRGFDPCLINASLPACKSEPSDAEAGVPDEASARPPETDDSGGV